MGRKGDGGVPRAAARVQEVFMPAEVGKLHHNRQVRPRGVNRAGGIVGGCLVKLVFYRVLETEIGHEYRSWCVLLKLSLIEIVVTN
jgi:hypothetical protein